MISMPYSSYLNTRVNSILVLSIAYIVAPLIGLSIYELSFRSILLLIIIEFLTGMMIGRLVACIFSSLAIVGEMIALQTNLSSLVVHDPMFEAQDSIFAKFFTFSCIVILFVYDVHLYLIRVIVESYVWISPFDNGNILFSEILPFIVKYFSDVLVIAVKIVAPIITLCILMNLVVGFINRLIPNVQFFFIAVPIQLMMLFFIIVFGLDTMLSYFIDNIHFVFEKLF